MLKANSRSENRIEVSKAEPHDGIQGTHRASRARQAVGHRIDDRVVVGIVDVVQGVVGFNAELNSLALAQVEGPGKRQIQADQARSGDCVASGIAVKSDRRYRKGVQVKKRRTGIERLVGCLGAAPAYTSSLRQLLGVAKHARSQRIPGLGR